MGAAGLLLLTPRVRPRIGPALRATPLPVTATVLSAIAHGTLVGVLVLAATLWSKNQPKTYVVNLVPAVAAVGTPQGRAVDPPRRQEPPPPPREPDPPTTPPERTAPPRPPAPPPELPSRPPELPARTPELPARTPELPARAPELPARTAAALPERPSLPRPSATPRPGEKELPPVASTPRPPASAPVAPRPSPATQPEAPAPPPPARLGRPTGSAQGSGAVTLDVSDFPFAWYLAAVQRKITERWEGRALQGRQPVVTFEVSRDGQVSNVVVKTSSGNQYYDLIATRAIAEAAPFPRLPDEFPGSMLRIHLGFNFAQDRG